MIRPRLVVPARDTCCRPTPHTLAPRVPGLAFNFSSVLPHRITGPLIEAESQRDTVRSSPRTRRITFILHPLLPTALAS